MDGASPNATLAELIRQPVMDAAQGFFHEALKEIKTIRVALECGNKRGGIEQMLNVKEVAEIFDISDQSVHRIINSGRIKFSKIGGAIRFDPQWIRDYQETNASGGVKTLNVGNGSKHDASARVAKNFKLSVG